MAHKDKTSDKYCSHCGFKVRKPGGDNKEIFHDQGAHHQKGSNGKYAPPSKTRRK